MYRGWKAYLWGASLIGAHLRLVVKLARRRPAWVKAYSSKTVLIPGTASLDEYRKGTHLTNTLSGPWSCRELRNMKQCPLSAYLATWNYQADFFSCTFLDNIKHADLDLLLVYMAYSMLCIWQLQKRGKNEERNPCRQCYGHALVVPIPQIIIILKETTISCFLSFSSAGLPYAMCIAPFEAIMLLHTPPASRKSLAYLQNGAHTHWDGMQALKKNISSNHKRTKWNKQQRTGHDSVQALSTYFSCELFIRWRGKTEKELDGANRRKKC